MADNYLATDEERNSLLVAAMNDPDTQTRYVLESYQQIKNRLSPDEARHKAAELYRAAGVAQCAKAMLSLLTFEDAKGFKPNKQKLEQAAQRAVNSAAVMLGDVEPFTDIQIGFGFKFEKAQVIPSITLIWGEDNLPLRIEDALSHANLLLQCAEAVETDTFLTSFLSSQGLEMETTEALLHEFYQYRLSQLEG